MEERGRSWIVESLAVLRIFSVASEVELSSCCSDRQEELGRGRTVHGERSDPLFSFLWTADGKNGLSCEKCTCSVNENEEFLFGIASMWKYMIGSVSCWITVLMCMSVCESLRNQGEQAVVWVLGMESCPQVWDQIVELRCQGPHQLVYASSVCTGPLLFGYIYSSQVFGALVIHFPFTSHTCFNWSSLYCFSYLSQHYFQQWLLTTSLICINT
jgi:hypothetical protein